MKYILSLVLILSSLIINAQNFWSDADESAIIVPRSAVQTHVPQEHSSLVLDFDEMDHYLRSAPGENLGLSGITFDLPMPNGEMEPFEVFSSNIMELPLAQKYPNIRSYKAVSINHPSWVARFDHSLWGFNASINTSEGVVYIQPAHSQTKQDHYSYYTKDYSDAELDMTDFVCGTEDAEPSNDTPAKTIDLRAECDPWPLRTFRLALACTGEWGGHSSLGGGTIESALAKMNSSINRVNQVYENEAGIRLILIAANDKIIFLKGAGDPYHTADEGRELIGQNTTILNRYVFSNSYDIGHVFTGSCSDVGGVASLASVCTSGKGAGVTCWYTSSVEYVSVNIVCHEMGHQFSCPHTFNNCNGNESGSTAFEPGGGSTIMSYSGLCGGQSFTRQADPNFHTNSLSNMITFSREIGANECGKRSDLGNTRPEVHIPYEDGFYIPILTPFELDATATDCEDDELTYSWEQYNIGRSINVGFPVPEDGDVPLFRVFPPTDNSKRIFPELNHILHNNNNSPVVDKSQVLPYYSRKFKFAFTVRDNHAGAGASNWDFVDFNVTQNAGPFEALTPERNETIAGGTYYLVQWSVANTDKAPVNCQEVDIIMYKDGNYDEPIILASKTNNDGSEYILFPNETISKARIKVKASHNIFFDITNYDFNVEKAEEPKVSVAVFPNYQFVCTPDKIDVTIKSTALKNSTKSIKILDIENLPSNVLATLSKSAFDSGDETILNLDFSDYHTNGTLEILVKYQIENGDSLYLSPIRIETIKNDYYQLALVGPKDEKGGSTGPTFQWASDEDADTYTIEVASNPSFSENTIIQRREGLTKTSLRLPLLEVNSIYYWRVRGENVCGPGAWTEASVNSTISQSCSSQTILDKDLVISTRKANSYKLEFPESVSISDINVSKIHATVNYVEDLTLKLKSPKGTLVTLWDKECTSSSVLNIGFDDEAPRTAVCPPQDRNVYRSAKGKLADFKGEDGLGNWYLEAELTQFTKAGRLVDFAIEICGDIAITPPELIKNEVLKTPPNELNTIAISQLESNDPNGENSKLKYTLVTLPKYGQLHHYGSVLNIGDEFAQSAISDWNFQYKQEGNHPGSDEFRFIVSDEEGGWTGLHQFDILIDDSYAVGSNDLGIDDIQFKITPNPASEVLNIRKLKTDEEVYSVKLYSTNGQIIHQSNGKIGPNGYQINVASLSSGLYYMHVSNKKTSVTQKVIIQ